MVELNWISGVEHLRYKPVWWWISRRDPSCFVEINAKAQRRKGRVWLFTPGSVAYAHRQRSAALRAKTKQPDLCARSPTFASLRLRAFAFISSKSRWRRGCQEDSNGAQNAAAASLAPRMHCGMPTPSYALPTNPNPGSLALNSRILLTRSTCPTWY